MKLTGLEKIYKELKIRKENYYIFPFKKNRTIFEVLFIIADSPFELYFLQKQSNFRFCIFVEKGFHIDTKLNNDVYSELCKVLNLKYDPNNKFSTYAFFDELNNKIPDYDGKREKREHELLNFYDVSDIEEPDKLYFDCFIEWKKVDSKKQVSQKNLEKTRILYPQHYEFCKRENISIRYTRKKM